MASVSGRGLSDGEAREASCAATLTWHEPRGGATDTTIERARAAVARQDWADAYAAFHDTDRTTMTGGDLEAFADAAWWGSKLPEALAIRKEA